jgi:anion-transporting  ArsA/GET3 family ATPase
MSKVMTSSRVFTYLAAAAPGMSELLTIGKVWDLAQLDQRRTGDTPYDLVVLDAPASGHALGMLRTPRVFGNVARVGPISRQAGRIDAFLTNPELTGVVAVAAPEEMPVNETIDFIAALHDEMQLAPDAVVVNGVYPDHFRDAEIAAIEGLGADSPALRAALATHRRRATPPQSGAAAAATGTRADVALPVRDRARRRRSGSAGRRAGETTRVKGVERVIEGAEICICAGAGGVGKTSTSAANRAWVRQRAGARTAVLTIDPAKRPGECAGARTAGQRAAPVRGVDGGGELWAMMLDAKRTFDELVETVCARRDDARRRAVEPHLPGAVGRGLRLQEYMAMEKLYELPHAGRFDLLVP